MEETASKDEIDAVGQVLCDSEKPLKERFRSLFTLRNLGGEYAIDYMVKAFNDSSALLKHEVAYCLGQMQDKYAIPFLVKTLMDVEQEPMVRHEAGEALGAIGDLKVLDLLKEYSRDVVPEVAETCQLAVKRLEWLAKETANTSSGMPVKGGKLPPNENSLYLSVDPAPPHTSSDVEELRKILIDEQLPLFDRYRAMFALRNIGSVDAITALSEGLNCPLSALFRHEVAFVFGQMQRAESTPALMDTLRKKEESEMVRHECAEALGSIGSEECNEILQQYLLDEARVVRESCEIALDISEYENTDNFQYADVLEKLRAGEN